jgi:nucleoside-diphosphate-sugar epimerase
VAQLLASGHRVAVAHSGAHEHPSVAGAEHLHGSREELLAAGGPVAGWRPAAIVDTFPGGATADKSRALAAVAREAGAHVVAISSIDVYRYGVDAGLGDGSGISLTPRDAIPLEESAPLRTAPYPGGSSEHDNVAMEAALREAAVDATALRPGTIYGPHAESREWTLVKRIHEGNRELPLPGFGGQVFHRVAVGRVGGAVLAAVERPQAGFWACNVVDPFDWTYGGLAAKIAEQLGWEWEPTSLPLDQVEHPWNLAHPLLCDDRRLREVLGVGKPDPVEALRETVDWLWRHRHEIADGG